MSDNLEPPKENGDHPLRRFVLDELHARPFAEISTPRRILLLAHTTGETAIKQDRQALIEFAKSRGCPLPDDAARHHSMSLDDGRLRWERHTEFSTYSWDMDVVGEAEWAKSPAMIPSGAPHLPGARVVASELLLIKGKKAAWTDADTVKWGFDAPSLCVADVKQGRATIVSDFRLWADGLTRVLVIDHDLGSKNAGELIQRLIEIETYRVFALFALPVVRQAAPDLAAMEASLITILSESDSANGSNHRTSLDQLTDLATRLEQQLAATSYRISASNAYEDILNERLEAIGETPHHTHLGWERFLNRRLGPALRTCASFGDRQDQLSRRLVRAAALLRTRVDIALEDQNNAVLQAMNKRSEMQLRLQHTVEGLSIAAVSYYIVGLVYYLAKGGEVLGMPLSPSLIAAIAVPVVIAWVAWLVSRIKHNSREKSED